MRFAMRDLRRAAVLRCRVEPLAALSIRLCATFSNFAAASKSPDSAALRAFFVKVRMVLLRARLAARAFSDLMMRFLADRVLAIVVLVTVPAALVRFLLVQGAADRLPGAAPCPQPVTRSMRPADAQHSGQT